MSEHVLVVRLDNIGDVLLTGPAVRAVAASADRVTFLCAPRGRDAACLLPGVDDVVVFHSPWIDPGWVPVDRDAVTALVERIAASEITSAIVCTSYHQSPLPTALVLRLAGVQRIAAISDDYPGSLLDVRHRIADDVHEVERALSLAATLGYRLPAGDDGRLALRPTGPAPEEAPETAFVALHPGASAPARAWAPERHAELVDALLRAGWRVAVTGGPDETDLTARVAGHRRPWVIDLGGRTSVGELAAVLARATAIVVGNTGPAHLAAAVGTPVVSLFAPTVPAVRWRPWGVPHALLGNHEIACAGCRAARCPLPGHPCVDAVTPDEVVAALQRVLSDKDATFPPAVAGSAGAMKVSAAVEPGFGARASGSELAGGGLTEAVE